MALDKHGHEVPDPTPVEVPLHLRRPASIQDDIKRMVREELSRAAADAGEETFEEADDFSVDDDPDPFSQYELSAMQEEAAMVPDASDLDQPEAPHAKPSTPEPEARVARPDASGNENASQQPPKEGGNRTVPT